MAFGVFQNIIFLTRGRGKGPLVFFFALSDARLIFSSNESLTGDGDVMERSETIAGK